MDFKKLGNVLMLAGVAILFGAVIWWFYFYSSLSRDFTRVTGVTPDSGISDALSCLYSSSGLCNLVAAAAPIAGRTAYEPMLFWFGIAVLLLGVLVRYTAKSGGGTK